MKVKEYSKEQRTNNQNLIELVIKKHFKTKSDGQENVIEKVDFVVEESPLEIRIKSEHESLFQPIAITMRTSGQDKLLALGFLFTEGIIQELNQVFSINQKTENIVEINLKSSTTFDISKITRKMYTSSSCGICSKGSIDQLEIESTFLPWTSKKKFSSEILFGLSQVFEHNTSIFSKSGGSHATALIDDNGVVLEVFEDVGRHNAMDKLIGHILQENKAPIESLAIVVSGRLSFELVQKASMVGTPLIVALGAPSSLAIQEAEEHGICLVGFNKKDSYNVYSAFERIVNEE